MSTTPTSVSPFLYLPVEVSARELDSKLLIACFAVGLGFEVVIGQTWLMRQNIHRMPPGLMLFKTLTTRDAQAMRLARSHGYRIASIDEEVPGVVPHKSGLRWTSEEAIEACDIVFAQGDDHRETLIRRFPAHRDKYVVVGNPRWDLLRPEFVGLYDEEVARIRRQYGPFILVNSNIGFVNSGKGSAERVIRILERGGKIDRRRPAEAAFLEQICRLEQGTLDGLSLLLPQLSQAFPDHRIVLRPHPGENMRTWQAVVSRTPRCELVRTGAAVPWILASDALVHTYCTTGVEAFALGKPAFSYRPIHTPVLENYLSPHVNFVVQTPEELILQVRAAITHPEVPFPYPPAFHAAFGRTSVGMSGPLAAERIVQSLAGHFAVELDPAAPFAKWQPLPGYARRIRSKAHQSRLMPPIERTNVLERLRRIDRRAGPDQIKVEACGDRLFHIHGHAGISYDIPSASRVSWLPEWIRRLGGESRGV